MATYQECVDQIVSYKKLQRKVEYPDASLSLNEKERLEKELKNIPIKKFEIINHYVDIWDKYGKVQSKYTAGLHLDETQFSVTMTDQRYSGLWMRGYIGKHGYIDDEYECYVEILIKDSILGLTTKEKLIRNAKPGDKFAVSGNAGFCVTSWVKEPGSNYGGDNGPQIIFAFKNDLSLSIRKL